MGTVIETISGTWEAEKIGAATIHSALGLGIGNQTARQIVVGKLTRKYRGGMPHPALEQICGCKSLVIDEVSMLTAKLLDLAFEVLEMVRTDLPQAKQQVRARLAALVLRAPRRAREWWRPRRRRARPDRGG